MTTEIEHRMQEQIAELTVQLIDLREFVNSDQFVAELDARLNERMNLK